MTSSDTLLPSRRAAAMAQIAGGIDELLTGSADDAYCIVNAICLGLRQDRTNISAIAALLLIKNLSDGQIPTFGPILS